MSNDALLTTWHADEAAMPTNWRHRAWLRESSSVHAAGSNFCTPSALANCRRRRSVT